jgi:hypothetical protein
MYAVGFAHRSAASAYTLPGHMARWAGEEAVMRYLVLMYEDVAVWAGRTAGEREALEAAFQDSDAALRQHGHLITAELLSQEAIVTTVRVGAMSVSVEEDPVGQAPGRLRAVLMLQARDLNAAIQVVATMPQARLGPAEVWALQA